jgi:hypothetical protein
LMMMTFVGIIEAAWYIVAIGVGFKRSV